MKPTATGEGRRFWRAHIRKVNGYYRVFYRRTGDPRAYAADEVPWHHRKAATSPAIDFVAALNAREHP